MGLGSAAADSLTSGNRNLSQAYTTSSTPPWPRHGSPLGWQGAPANTPSLAAPTAQHGWALPSLMQGHSPSPCGCTARMAGSQEPQHTAAPSPRVTFAREPPGRREQSPAAQRLRPDTACIHGAAAPGQRGGKSSPRLANKTGIQGRAQAAALGRPGPSTRPAGHGISLPGLTAGGLWSPDAPDTLLARSHAGPALPSAHVLGMARPRALGRAQVVTPKLPAPQSTWHVPPCPAAHTSH